MATDNVIALNYTLNAKQMEALVTPSTEIMYGGSKGGGKAQILTTWVLTTTGWKMIKDIHPGEYVFGDDGEPTLVVAESEIDTEEDTYEITFDDGSKETVGANHEWGTQTLNERNLNKNRSSQNKKIAGGIRNTKTILETLRSGETNVANHAIPIAKGLQYPEQELEVPPYVLGSGLVDTGLTVITSSKYKHIPMEYKTASYEQRLELVRGMMDGVGTIDTNGNCELCLSDKILADDVLGVIRSLGIKCTQVKIPNYFHNGNKRDSYSMVFTTKIPVFRLSRMKERLPEKVKQTAKFWYICDIKKVETQPKKCIEVSNKSHLYLIGKSLIPTHNSYLARYASILYAATVPGLQIYIFRRTFSEVRGNFLFGDSGLQAMLADAVKKGGCNINLSENKIHFNNGSDIYLRHMQTPQDVEQIRGRDIHVLICDEATQWMTRDIYNQLRTCMRCAIEIDYGGLAKDGLTFMVPGYFPRAYILTNPGGIAHTFIKSEFIDRLEPNTPTQMAPEDGGMLREFIPAKLADNTALMNTDPNYRSKLLGSGKHVKAMLEGDWSIPEGAALANEWKPEFNLVDPFLIPSSAKIKRCFDWGTAKPFACTYVWETRSEEITLANGDKRVFPPGTMFVVGEYYGWSGQEDEGSRLTNKQMGVALKYYEMNRYWGKQILPGPSDGSIFDGRGTDKTIADDIAEGYNSVSGKDQVWTQVTKTTLFKRADKSKGSRHKGLSMVKSYLQGAHLNEDGQPSERAGLIFFKTAEQCIRTLPALPYSLLDPDDVDTKAEDHLYDTIRYAVLGRMKVFKQLNIIGY